MKRANHIERQNFLFYLSLQKNMFLPKSGSDFWDLWYCTYEVRFKKMQSNDKECFLNWRLAQLIIDAHSFFNFLRYFFNGKTGDQAYPSNAVGQVGQGCGGRIMFVSLLPLKDPNSQHDFIHIEASLDIQF